MEKLKKKFNKHYVKRDPSNQKMEFDDDGNGIPGEFIRDTTLLSEQADELNLQSEHHGFVWVEVKEEEKKEPVQKSPERIKLEADATDLGITFRDNIGDAKLQEKINAEINK